MQPCLEPVDKISAAFCFQLIQKTIDDLQKLRWGRLFQNKGTEVFQGSCHRSFITTGEEEEPDMDAIVLLILHPPMWPVWSREPIVLQGRSDLLDSRVRILLRIPDDQQGFDLVEAGGNLQDLELLKQVAVSSKIQDLNVL